MSGGSRTARGIWGVIILLAFATMGSNGSCAGTGGPYGPGWGYPPYGGPGYGGPGYGGPGYGGPQTQNFYTPALAGNRVDWCLHWGSSCGAPAANEFCRRVGYSHASAFSKADNIGAHSPTVVLGSGAVCNQAHCDGFQNITCTQGWTGGSGSGSGYSSPSGSFTYEDNTDRTGMDYRHFTPTHADAKQCKNRCRQESQCLAYTYVKASVVPPRGRCYLKSGVPAAVNNTCCISGVKQ